MDLRFTLTSSIGFILNKPHYRTSAACGCLPFTLLHLTFHFCFILLFHILNLEPESGSEQTSVGFHRTPTWITYLYMYCRTTCRYSVQISTGLAKSLSDSKSNLSLSKSAASALLDHPYSLSKPSLSMDSVPQSNLRASAQG